MKINLGFKQGDRVKITEPITYGWGENELTFWTGSCGTVMETVDEDNPTLVIKVAFDNETDPHYVWRYVARGYLHAYLQPTDTTERATLDAIAAVLAVDVDTTTDAGILEAVRALVSENARLRDENENRGREINNLYRAIANHDIQVMIRDGKDIT